VRDVWTVVWKETRALLSNRGSVFLGYGIIVFVFGVFMLVDSAPEIAAGEVSRPLLIFSALGVILSSSQTARSFAGERDAKTLASLLCTRISDRDLFLGKTLSIVLFTSVMLTATGLLHLASVNLVARLQGGGWVFYQSRPEFIPFLILLPLSVVCFTAVVGVLISLKVQSTRGAYLLNLFSGAPAMGAAYAVVRGRWGWGWPAVLAVSVAGFGVLVLGFSVLAVKRFRRETLVLVS
jgi:ABC-2 type transport system permease protein